MLPLNYRQSTLAQPDLAEQQLIQAGLHPWVAKALVLRNAPEVEIALGQYRLEHYAQLKGIHSLALQVAEGIERQEKFMVVADYDCDGATACAVAVSGLRALGANIDFVVPNRFVHGYGLTPSVVEVVAEHNPRWIVTVDNGIASHAGIAAAHAKGIGVLVTDHHLPGDTIPETEAIVNPNQPGCEFPSKNLAGVGVMYYVLAAVKQTLIERGHAVQHVNLADWIDIVALGTVADVVRLDANNRWLVRQGLQRIRNGKACPGIHALFEVSGKQTSRATAQDFGFGLGPRINAAGRLEDMTIGIRCLLAQTDEEAMFYAQQLQEFNEQRKSIENEMKETAWSTIDLTGQEGRFTRVVYDPGFHEGVIGIVAGRIKEESHTPVVVFAKAQEEGMIKGSGRSIPGVHLRDVLDLVHKRGQNLFAKFGGHSMAAGMSLLEADLDRFMKLFEEATKEVMGGVLPQKYVDVDGRLDYRDIDIRTAEALMQQVWGQGFEEPTFIGTFQVKEANLIGQGKHLKMKLGFEDREWTALHFFCDQLPEGEVIDVVYRLSVNDFRGERELNLMVIDKGPSEQGLPESLPVPVLSLNAIAVTPSVAHRGRPAR